MRTIRELSKVLLYSHDTYGLGHLRRNLVIARQLLGGALGTRVVLASGSPVLDRVHLPAGLVSVQLPPVVKTGADEYRSADPQLSISLVSRARSAVLSDIVTRWRPDVFLVDHSPQGMKGELLPVFDTLRAHSPDTKVVLGLRDILDDPERVRATWTAKGIYDTLEEIYDHIAVYGERDIFDLADAYRIPRPVASRLEYCGYVTGDRPERSVRPAGVPADTDYVLGTVGGGGDGVEVLLATAQAATRMGSMAVLCTGPLMTGSDRRLLDKATAGLGGTLVVEHLHDVAAVASGARCVVSRGGYNSLCELINLGVPTVVVPRAWPRREQLLRARAFAARGLVQVVEEGDETLHVALSRAVHDAITPSTSERRPLDLCGRERLTAALATTAAATALPQNRRPRNVALRISA